MADRPGIIQRVRQRLLGDVPGIDDIIPLAQSAEYMPTDVLEVNGVGEIVGAEVGLGDMATSMYQDPFAVDPYAVEEEPAPGEPSPSPGGDTPIPTGSSSTGSASAYTGGTVSSAPVEGFDEEQLQNAATIAEVGRDLGASERDIQIALMTAIVESGLRNLDYGDRDSVGLFQQRDAWGSFEDRTDPAKAAAMFFQGGAAGQQGLFDVPDRDKRPMGEVAQDVQVSAYPDRYAQHEQDASRILASLSGETFSGSVKGKDPYDLTEIDGHTVDYLTAAALDAAKNEFGADLSIMQGSHNASGVAASGGTHDGGGVIDVSVPNGDWAGAVAALRKIGFAAWVRNVPGYGQAGSGAHIHAVLIGDKELSPQAQTQVQSYFNNDDGLTGSRADDGPREFVNNRFTWADAMAAADDDEFGEQRKQVTASGDTFLGVPHKWGGDSYSGIDGANLIRKLYADSGVDLPKNIHDVLLSAEPMDPTKAKPGDLIGWGDDQFGMVTFDGYVVENNRPGGVVQRTLMSTLEDPWVVPLRTLMRPDPVSTAPAYRPPPITYAAPVAGPAPTAPGVRTGGYNPAVPDAAPHQGMNSGGGGSKPKPSKPTTTKKPPDISGIIG